MKHIFLFSLIVKVSTLCIFAEPHSSDLEAQRLSYTSLGHQVLDNYERKGLLSDLQQSILCYEQAFELGYNDACTDLGCIYLSHFEALGLDKSEGMRKAIEYF